MNKKIKKIKKNRKNTQVKIQKNKNRKTRKLKFKKIKGGKIGDDPTDTRIPIITVLLKQEEILTRIAQVNGLTHEVCGIYIAEEVEEDATFKLILKSINENFDTGNTDRPSCVHIEKDKYTIIWHTHPYTSKFYPSTNDLITTKKIRNGERIQISILYTTLGMWIIQSLDDRAYQDGPQYYEDAIRAINKDFYESTNGGRDISDIGSVLSVANGYYKQELAALGINIELIPIGMLKSVPITLNNVRRDALMDLSKVAP